MNINAKPNTANTMPSCSGVPTVDRVDVIINGVIVDFSNRVTFVVVVCVSPNIDDDVVVVVVDVVVDVVDVDVTRLRVIIVEGVAGWLEIVIVVDEPIVVDFVLAGGFVCPAFIVVVE